MGLISDAAKCHDCGGETSLSYGVPPDLFGPDVYTVFCLKCRTQYKPDVSAIVALQNARNNNLPLPEKVIPVEK